MKLTFLFYSTSILLKKKILYYDNKHSLTALCAMGFNIIMDKYFKSVYFVWTILWISYNTAYRPFSNFIYTSFSFRRKSKWYCSFKWFNFRSINNFFINILFTFLYITNKTSYSHFISFTIYFILLV